MDIFTNLLNQGLLGVVVVLLLTGWLAPKYVMEACHQREVVKDAIIARQSALIEKLAEEAARKGRGS